MTGIRRISLIRGDRLGRDIGNLADNAIGNG
jgi:hypothetical protein